MAYEKRHELIIQPGPLNDELLKLQRVHRSQLVWQNEDDTTTLKVQRTWNNSMYQNIDPRIIHYMKVSGFHGIASVGNSKLDHHLITALVERWRPETHTFHLPVGEATITLQDVEVLTGLPVDGKPVTGSLKYNWPQLCEELLGVMPPEGVIDGNAIKMTWLLQEFKQLPEDADDHQVQCYARALILRIFGGLVFANKTSCLVHLMFLPLLRDFEEVKSYAWGAAVLGFLYRELCKATNPKVNQISGCLLILQLWAYERITHIAPKLSEATTLFEDNPYSFRWKNQKSNSAPVHNVKSIRLALDEQERDQIIWEPYKDVISLLPPTCTAGQAVWRSVVPLMCFHIVEFHQPDRCLRQFGMEQPIPQMPFQLDSHHTIDLRGNQHIDWEVRHASFIEAWNNRLNRIATTPPLQAPLGPQSQYLQWYIQRTRRWLTPKGARKEAIGDGLQTIYHMCESRITPNVVKQISASLLGSLNSEERLAETFEAQPAVPSLSIPHVAEPEHEFKRRRRTVESRRQAIPDPPLPYGIERVPPPMLYDLYSGRRAAEEMGRAIVVADNSSYSGIDLNMPTQFAPRPSVIKTEGFEYFSNDSPRQDRA